MQIYNDTITIFNKIDGTDTVSEKDEIQKTVLSGCGWYSQAESSVSGSNVSIGQKGKVLIPFDKGYSTYEKWKTTKTGFTMRLSDYVFKGEISDEVTISNLSRIYNKYKPNAIKVKYIDDLEKRTGVPIKIQLRIEG